MFFFLLCEHATVCFSFKNQASYWKRVQSKNICANRGGKMKLMKSVETATVSCAPSRPKDIPILFFHFNQYHVSVEIPNDGIVCGDDMCAFGNFGTHMQLTQWLSKSGFDARHWNAYAFWSSWHGGATHRTHSPGMNSTDLLVYIFCNVCFFSIADSTNVFIFLQFCAIDSFNA